MDHSLGTLEPSRIAMIPHQTVLAVTKRHPELGHLLWRDTLVDAAMFREWMVGIGRRPAYARVAHVLCEMMVRMAAVGLAEDHTCELRVTQSELADALGLSAVHINRVLQSLRGAALIDLRAASLKIVNWTGLKKAGEFDPAYLHLEPTRVAA
jgi:CRP-like cAMP-binding protein